MAIDRMKDISVFVHVAEAKSFTAAAERIGLSRSAVGKSVVRLEDRLGVRLLQRTTRSVSLTGEGAAFHERCVRLLADLDEAEMSMLSHSQAPRGRLRLESARFVRPTACAADRQSVHEQMAGDFRQRFLQRSLCRPDRRRRRSGDPDRRQRDGRLMTRLLAPHRLVTCASPAYLETRGMPKDIDAVGRA